MFISRRKKVKEKKKLNKKRVLISTCCCMLLLFMMPTAFAGIDDMIFGAICFVIRSIGDCIAGLMGDKFLDRSLERLIFNVSDLKDSSTIFTDYNLTLLTTSGSLSTNMFKLYYVFLYIAISLLGCVFLWTAFDFYKSANDPQHINVLKSRLKKLFITVVLLLSLPYLFDMVMTINQAILDVFRLIGIDLLGDKMSHDLLGTFKTLSTSENTNIALAILYVMAGLINVWLVVFYMLRDFAICILFIIVPLIIICVPYKTDLIMQWLKEMCSNIFTQAIQAFLFLIIMVLASAISEGSSNYQSIFVLVAFGYFIPMTGKIKKMLGLEGELGAAKSNAGLGAITGAMAVAGIAALSAKNTFGTLRSGRKDLQALKSEEKLMSKSSSDEVESGVRNTSSTGSGGVGASVGGSTSSKVRSRGIEVDPNNRSSENRNHGVELESSNGVNVSHGGAGGETYSATSRARQIKGMKSQVRRNMVNSVLGGAVGVVGAGLGAGVASVYGDSRLAMGAAFGGMYIGNSVGSAVGNVGSDIASGLSEYAQDKAFGEGIRYDGEQNPTLTPLTQGVKMPTSISDIKDNFNTIKGNYSANKNFINENKSNLEQVHIRSLGMDTRGMSSEQVQQEKSALISRNRLERRGKFTEAHNMYARKTYDRNQMNFAPGNPYRTQIAETGMPKYDLPTPKIETSNDTDNINTLNKSLDMHMQDYLNNNDYLSALDNCSNSQPPMFTGGDNSQLC